jgi:hypothetical protein
MCVSCELVLLFTALQPLAPAADAVAARVTPVDFQQNSRSRGCQRLHLKHRAEGASGYISSTEQRVPVATSQAQSRGCQWLHLKHRGCQWLHLKHRASYLRTAEGEACPSTQRHTARQFQTDASNARPAVAAAAPVKVLGTELPGAFNSGSRSTACCIPMRESKKEGQNSADEYANARQAVTIHCCCVRQSHEHRSATAASKLYSCFYCQRLGGTKRPQSKQEDSLLRSDEGAYIEQTTTKSASKCANARQAVTVHCCCDCHSPWHTLAPSLRQWQQEHSLLHSNEGNLN